MTTPAIRIPIAIDLFLDPVSGSFRGADGTPRRDELGFAELVRLLVDRSGLSTTGWAESIDIDPRLVRRWKAGDELPHIAVRQRLVRMLLEEHAPKSAATDPHVLAILVAPLFAKHERESGYDEGVVFDQLVARARLMAAAIDRGVEAERNVREHAMKAPASAFGA